MKYTCIGCNKVFSHTGNYMQHMNNKTPCLSEKNLVLKMLIKMQQSNEKLTNRINKQDKEIKEYNEKFKKQNQRIDNLSKQVALRNSNKIYNDSVDNSITVNKTTNITVNLVNIGEENLKYIMAILRNNSSELITDNPVDSLGNCMEKIYYNDNTPENYIIKYDQQNDQLLIHHNGKWSSKKISYIIKNIKPFFTELGELYDTDYEKYNCM